MVVRPSPHPTLSQRERASKSVLFLTPFLSRSRFRNSINRRRSRHFSHWILIEKFHRFLHSSLQLRVVSINYCRRCVINFNVRWYAFILDGPLSREIIKRQDRRG